MRNGKLHSIETMGLVDGPGIRTVFFLQGCPLKCQYCHNPDSQSFMGSSEITVEDVVQTARRYREYYQATGGGVTFSGGEPLMQGAFLIEALSALKAEGFSTCIDTSGYGQTQYYDDVFRYTDHILLDLKHTRNDAHKALTGRDMTGIRHFIKSLQGFDGTVTIRHVMVPGATDSDEYMAEILAMIEPIQKKVDKIDILPYHKAGVEKYSQLNLTYALASIPEMSHDRAKAFERSVNEALSASKRRAYRQSA
ncbi:pyruvate formate-lyase-activating protein [Acidaminobacter hydrogenoformans]|uniref:Pyruvate formate-lyase-activating enzyme n=1 Tax=Acidaminobacter hydrogenoformans DSM 2784 TaxID=1120920 RepID=A0A1G5S1J8_9FIRM|nr:pyruvate formate-lyase-activating protein [Acidaminobacter hydrogenoformans]SCZ79439.1 pyruvate formate lyase activating enzyme [Acidaminobacter hydrogenoformans DSM 2784]